MDREQFLKKVRALLAEAFGDRLQGVVLYGSEARGEAQPDSDIDLLVLLSGPVDWHDRWRIVDALYELQLEVENCRQLEAYPMDVAAYEAGELTFFRNARREGIRV
ncbi:MAG: nucleotidyltransferase domain-containing protein [Thermodesulfobacteriota bacterium]